MRGVSEKPIINFIGFQLIWWLCVLFNDATILICCLLLTVHLAYHSRPLAEFKSMLVIGAIGYCIDSLLTTLGVFEFSNHAWLAPMWLGVLWLGFATNISCLSSNLALSPFLLAIIGFVLVPFSYIGAAHLNAVVLPYGTAITWLTIAMIWAFLLPLLFNVQYMLRRQNEYAQA
jgi:hypothetical protein